MASFPEITLSESNFKVRFREQYASEVINQRFMGLPFGVYSGFDPLVAGDNVSLKVDAGLEVSILRAMSSISKTSLDVFFEADVSLNFTGHDFVASGDLYVIATVSYVRNGTTTARIFTSASPASGTDSIGICRLAGTAAPGVITSFSAAIPDKHSPLANTGSPNTFGFMPPGSIEDIAAALAGLGNCDVDTTVRLVGFNVPAADAGSVFLLDMAAIVANADVLLPASAGLNEGDSFGFFSLTGIPGGFDVRFTRDGADEIIYNGALATQHLMRKHVGAFVKFTLIITGVTNPTWFVKVMTLPSLHAFSHLASGDDEILLDTLGEPTDNTNLNATIGRHGLLPKLSNNVLEFFNGVGAFTVPGGATSGANQYIIKATTVTTSQALLGDGEIYRVSPPPASGLTTLTLPDATVAAAGIIVRVFFITDAQVAPNNVLFDSVGASFLWDGTALPNFTSDFRVGQFLEFTLNKPTDITAWVITSNAGLDSHAVRHATGADDALDVTTLAGFPGGGTTFLRADGTFGPTTPLAVLSVRAAAGAIPSPIDWTIIDSNEPGSAFTISAGDTIIEVPSIGHYILMATGQTNGTGVASITIEKKTSIDPAVIVWTSQVHASSNVGGAAAASASVVVGLSITDPGNELIRVTSGSLGSNARLVIVKVA